MTVIVVAIIAVAEGGRRSGQLLHGFTDAHNLKGLFAADAGSSFEITLQGTRTNTVLCRQGFYGGIKIIVLVAVVQYTRYNIYILKRAGVLFNDLIVVGRNDLYAFLEAVCFPYFLYYFTVYKVGQGEDVVFILRKIDWLFVHNRRYLELNAKEFVSGGVVADHVLVAGQKAIGLNIEAFLFQLHHTGCAQVDQVGIPGIGEQGIGESFGVAAPEGVKVRLPKEINELRKRLFCLLAVVPVFKVIGMKEFNMLHKRKIRKRIKSMVDGL